ncbi:Protein of unknown function DUF2079, membrane [[Leptolyngbya] sp. PCC 7376]|uniref:DUF2079 domain-containing protein n=1 Tax=[Leptolyngbya] sp. PCC 7376 TaxID=111781 RepID=UPI00029F1B4C|nr:DUF2079 domain-containing protein [[Leptolyngbya] sp. PCC 7376]AFY36927.1 Protein of unknown function DUF2079, membrane [[Leptolyngbya] sp. PCC 7376]
MESSIRPSKASKELWIVFLVSSSILFGLSSLRHWLFQSDAYDLGIFDQAIYLISQGESPFSTFMGFHILGDHAAWMHYLLAIPYILFPSVYWLFLIQACALAAGIFPTYYLSLDAGLSRYQAQAMMFVYLLYPVIFNANLFDFHPEVIAVPFLFWAILAARRQQLWLFLGCLVFILGCKAVLSLTVLGLGIWLLLVERKNLYGAIAISLGVAWFIFSTQWIIPNFSGGEAAAVGRYSYLGDSVFEILRNLILQPQRIFSILFSLSNLEYLVLLFVPVAWGWSRFSFSALVGAFPAMSLNLLADHLAQKDLVHQYALPILPFLIIGLISSLAAEKGFFQQRRAIIIWSLITFACLAKFTYFGGHYLSATDNLWQTHEAIALVEGKGGVYTASQIAPHLSHRENIRFTRQEQPEETLETFDYILLNRRHPGWLSDAAFVDQLIMRVSEDQSFDTIYQEQDVFLFSRNR